MDCGLLGVRFLFSGRKKGTAIPVDNLIYFCNSPVYLEEKNMDNKIRQILDNNSDSEILLIVPPFSLLDLPCIGLDILKTIAESMQIKTTVLYSNMLFANYIGVDKYKQISIALMSMHTMLGERIFANAANENMPLLGIDFLKKYDENFNDVFLELSSVEEISDIAKKAKEWFGLLYDIYNALKQINASVDISVETAFLPKDNVIAKSEGRGTFDRIQISTEGEYYYCPLLVSRVNGCSNTTLPKCNTDICPILTLKLDEEKISSVCCFLVSSLKNAIKIGKYGGVI